MDTKQPPTTWGSLLEGVNCLKVFPKTPQLNFTPVQVKPRLNTYPVDGLIQP